MRTKRALLLFIATFLTHTFALAQEYEPRFYNRKAEGWFWYKEQIPETPKAIEPPEPAALIDIQKQPKKNPATESIKVEGPVHFSASWFRENLPKYKDLAWNNPTVANLRNYLYLQRYALDRSEQFSDAAEMAVVGDPFLDEESRRPSATFASQKLDRWAGLAKNSLVHKIAQHAGIFFFFESNSDTSRIQAPVLKMLAIREGFTIFPISVDGNPLPGALFPNFKTDNGQANKLGAKVFPALYLVSKDREVEPIAQGVLSLADLKHRIILVARRRGWVSEEEFNKTKPIINLENNVAALLDNDFESLATVFNDNSQNTKNNFIPPEQLSAFFKKHLQTRR